MEDKIMIYTLLKNKRSQEGTGNILFTEIPDSIGFQNGFVWLWCDSIAAHQLALIPDPPPLLTT